MIECRNVNLQQSIVRKGTPFRWTKLSEDPSCINREKYVFSPEDPVTKKMHAWMNGYYNKITTFIQKIHFHFMLILIKVEQKRPEIVFMQKQNAIWLHLNWSLCILFPNHCQLYHIFEMGEKKSEWQVKSGILPTILPGGQKMYYILCWQARNISNWLAYWLA